MSLDRVSDLESTIRSFQRWNGSSGIDTRTSRVVFPTNPQNHRDSAWGLLQQQESKPPGANAAKAWLALHQNSGQTRKSRNGLRLLRRRRLPRAVDTTDSRQQIIPARDRQSAEREEEDPTLSENPAGPENAIHSRERRYSLVSSHVKSKCDAAPKCGI